MHRFALLILLLLALTGLPARSLADDVAAAFDQANRLGEQGKYADAIAAYEKILGSGRASPALYFNLGNAWFKSGHLGRAILSYRLAARLAPFKVIAIDLGRNPDGYDFEEMGEVQAQQERKVVLRVPRDRAAEITGRLLADLPVLDLTIEDPPIEDVIKQVFANGVERLS